MKPTTAAAFIKDATNSASPNARTPQRLMPNTDTRNMAMAAGSGINSECCQKVSVLSAAMISRGMTTSHCMT